MASEKDLLLYKQAREKIFKGIESLLELTSYTYGPMGSNIKVISQDKSSSYSPKTYDILKELSLNDKYEKIGEHFAKAMIRKMQQSFKDGNCLTLILFHALVKASLSCDNPQLQDELSQAQNFVLEYLNEHSYSLENEDTLLNLLKCKLPHDHNAALLLSELFQEIGCEGDILIEHSHSSQHFAQILPGVRVESGYASSYFCDSKTQAHATLQNPYLLLLDFPLKHLHNLMPLFKDLSKNEKPLLLLAPSFHPDILATLSLNQLQKTLKLCPMLCPKNPDEKDLLFKCLSITCQTPIFTSIEQIKGKELGYLKKALIYEKHAHFLFDDRKLSLAYDELENLENLLSEEQDPKKVKAYKKCIDFILGYMGIIYLSEGVNPMIEESALAISSCLKENMLLGGGLSLYRASTALLNSPLKDSDGSIILAQALQAPLNQLIENSTPQQKTALLDKISNGPYEEGFNAQNNRIENLKDACIFDPKNLVTKALELSCDTAKQIFNVDGLIC